MTSAPQADRLTVFGQIVSSKEQVLERFRAARQIADLKTVLELDDNCVWIYESGSHVWIVNAVYSLNAYFYSHSEASFLHGDTIDTIARNGPVDLTWDYEALADFLAFGHLVGEETLVRGV